ncbi:MAG: hypothetical protein AMXMBFR4_22280 [Candidatus Hydrogenedentota bacterium]
MVGRRDAHGIDGPVRENIAEIGGFPDSVSVGQGRSQSIQPARVHVADRNDFAIIASGERLRVRGTLSANANNGVPDWRSCRGMRG